CQYFIGKNCGLCKHAQPAHSARAPGRARPGPVALGAMCGIVAVLRQPSTRPAPDPGWILTSLDEAEQRLAAGGLADLELAVAPLQDVDQALRGTPGLRCLLGAEGLPQRVAASTARIGTRLGQLEQDLDSGVLEVPPARQEEGNATLVALKDAWWGIDGDRLGMARGVADLMPAGAPATALDGWWSIQVALASLDRLEVRGRDSAGLHVLVAGHDLEPGDPGVRGR